MKDFWSPLQEIIKEFCISFDKKWQTRKRVIDSHFLVLFIFKLVLRKNKQGYKSLLNELWEKQELATYQRSPISSDVAMSLTQTPFNCGALLVLTQYLNDTLKHGHIFLK